MSTGGAGQQRRGLGLDLGPSGPDLGGASPAVPLVSGVPVEPIPWPSAVGVLDLDFWPRSSDRLAVLFWALWRPVRRTSLSES
jgi:hypothetical protein